MKPHARSAHPPESYLEGNKGFVWLGQRTHIRKTGMLKIKIQMVPVLLPPQLTCDTSEMLMGEEKSFSYSLLWDETPKYSVLQQCRAGLCWIIPPIPLPKHSQGLINQHVFTARCAKSHCLKPHIILEHLQFLLLSFRVIWLVNNQIFPSASFVICSCHANYFMGYKTSVFCWVSINSLVVICNGCHASVQHRSKMTP